jgi:hypothetical protein
MESPEGARRAIEQLNGSFFEERRLRVNEAGENSEDSGPRSGSGSKKPEVRVTMQFRERNCMTYELDCAGIAVSVRMFPTDPTEKEWRLEANEKRVAGDTSGPAAVIATAPTRALALEQVARTWDVESSSRGLPAVAWIAITQALVAVRAV